MSNYIPLRDIAADWRINIRAWLAKGKLQRIAKAINNREAHTTWQLFKNFCGKYHNKWLAGQQKILSGQRDVRFGSIVVWNAWGACIYARPGQ